MKEFFEDVFDDVRWFFHVFPRMIVSLIIIYTIVLGPLFLLKWLLCGE
ncbi:MAG: hypothetical protein J6S67_25950 [Methanobrevibacter sp.]|nr:hypothetical protein [Methanobrevibacter sp.]